MKRKWVWLMLPLVLCALVSGVKWRADHPPVTQWDSQVRSLISKTPISVVYSPHLRKRRVKFLLSKEEKKTFIDSFHLSQQLSSRNGVSNGINGVLDVLCYSNKPVKKGTMNVSIIISLDQGIGQVDVSESGNSKLYDLHPATTKRWLELLLNHPVIGPELRARMNR